jgi:hypothetical protein
MQSQHSHDFILVLMYDDMSRSQNYSPTAVTQPISCTSLVNGELFSVTVS